MKSTREDILDLPVIQGEFYMDDLVKRVVETYKVACLLCAIDLVVLPYENRLLHGDLD